MSQSTAKPPPPEPADAGSLDPEVASDIRILDEFLRDRDRALGRLMGRRVKPSPVRDTLVRQIILNFAEGRIERIAAYQKSAPAPATKTGIRRDLDLLEATGLIFQRPDPSDARAVLVVPSTKLVQFYNDAMPRLASEIRRLLPTWFAHGPDGDGAGTATGSSAGASPPVAPPPRHLPD